MFVQHVARKVLRQSIRRRRITWDLEQLEVSSAQPFLHLELPDGWMANSADTAALADADGGIRAHARGHLDAKIAAWVLDPKRLGRPLRDSEQIGFSQAQRHNFLS